MILGSGTSVRQKDKVLIFSKTTRYHHESIPDGIKAIVKLGQQNNFEVDATTDSGAFTAENLKKYKAIIFLSTSGNNLLDTVQKTCLVNYIKSGGGFVGIHSASASEKNWPWYGKLIGAVFTDHPEPQFGNILVTNTKDPSTKHLPKIWKWKDEWYNFIKISTKVNVLLCAEEASYTGGKHGKYHPLAWTQRYDGGRVFYTALGHFSEAYSDTLFLRHLQGGINFALGKK